MSFVPLKDVIANKPVKDRQRMATPTDLFNVFTESALQEIGLEAVAHIFPLYQRGGVLTIFCAARFSADLMQLKEKDILDRINRKFGNTVLKGIRRVG